MDHFLWKWSEIVASYTGCMNQLTPDFSKASQWVHEEINRTLCEPIILDILQNKISVAGCKG